MDTGKPGSLMGWGQRGIASAAAALGLVLAAVAVFGRGVATEWANYTDYPMCAGLLLASVPAAALAALCAWHEARGGGSVTLAIGLWAVASLVLSLFVAFVVVTALVIGALALFHIGPPPSH